MKKRTKKQTQKLRRLCGMWSTQKIKAYVGSLYSYFRKFLLKYNGCDVFDSLIFDTP
jgi:hypothetical protein